MIHDSVFPAHNEGKGSAAALDARLEGFLYSSIGMSDDGIPLTVISALARRGCDPWTEAARLSALPRAHAAETLTLLISDIPPVWCRLPDQQGTVARLLKLLPRAEARAPVHRSYFLEFKARHKAALLPIFCVVLFAAVLAGYAFQ